ncbi:MAG: CRTAC1 family protein [Gammaproteobacteria bacterium]
MKKIITEHSPELVSLFFLSSTLLFPSNANAERFAKDRGVVFDNVSEILGPYARSNSGGGLGGMAWLDYDRDNDLDLYITNGVGGTNGLFRNNGDGTFTDVTLAAGVAGGTGNTAAVAGDLDNDGYPDLFLTGEGRLAGPIQTPTVMYRNNGDGTFSDITALSGVVGADSALAAALADINNDGWLDIFIASPGHIPFLTGPGTGTSDANKLYLNNGDLTFTDITDSAGVSGLYIDSFGDIVSDGACVASFQDYDKDGDADLFVGNCNAFFSPNIDPPPFVVRPGPLNLYRNNGDNTFTDVAGQAGINALGLWMGLAFGDYDNDGDIDLYATSTGTAAQSAFPHALFRNNGDGTYTSANEEAGIGNSEFSWGVTFADFDNNGGLDLFQSGSLPMFGLIGPGRGNPGRLFMNDGNGFFDENVDATGIDLSAHYTSGVAQADYDNDGFVDLAVMTAPFSIPGVSVASDDFVLLQNQGNSNHWLTVRLVGTVSNRDAIGAVIEAKTGEKKQLREVTAGSSFSSTESPWPTFGLGKYRQAKITVSWPSGLVEVFPANHADRMITLVEGTGRRYDNEEDD